MVAIVNDGWRLLGTLSIKTPVDHILTWVEQIYIPFRRYDVLYRPLPTHLISLMAWLINPSPPLPRKVLVLCEQVVVEFWPQDILTFVGSIGVARLKCHGLQTHILKSGDFRGGSRGEGAHPARAPLKLEKIWFFGVKSWFFTRNTPQIFAPPSARRNFFKCAPPPPLAWNPGSAPGLHLSIHNICPVFLFPALVVTM